MDHFNNRYNNIHFIVDNHNFLIDMIIKYKFYYENWSHLYKNIDYFIIYKIAYGYLIDFYGFIDGIDDLGNSIDRLYSHRLDLNPLINFIFELLINNAVHINKNL